MFPGISDYLKSTLGNTTTLSDFVQPDKIAAAALFLLLNLIDIILLQSTFNSPLQKLVNDYFGLNPALQALLAAALILMLAYLLLSFNTVLYRLLTGESWMESWLGQWLSDRQKRVRDRLLNASSQIDQGSLLKRQQLITSFAKEKEFVYPTSLGNVQNATASYIWHHYGIDMAALWPHMDSILSKANEALSKRIDNEKATLDFLVNMTFLLVIFALELILQSFALMTQWNVLWAIIPLILAWITFTAATNKARSWGDVVQMAFDMHRDDLRQKLSIRAFTSEEDEREVWQRVSSQLLWGNRADDVFVTGTADSKSSSPSGGGTDSESTTGASDDKSKGASSNGKPAGNKANQPASDPAAAATAVCKILSNADKVQAELQSTVVHLDPPQPWPGLPANVLQVVSQYIDYLLVVTIKDGAPHAGGAAQAGEGKNKLRENAEDEKIQPDAKSNPPATEVYLAISDPRLPVIYQVPEAKKLDNTTPYLTQYNQSEGPPAIVATILGDPGRIYSQGQVIWQITTGEANCTLAIRFQLPSHMFTALINEEKPQLTIDVRQLTAGKYASAETYCADTRTIDYKIAFNAPPSDTAKETFLEVYDSRITQLDTPKFGCLWFGAGSDPHVLQAKKLSAPDRYLWRLPSIPQDTPVTLMYTV